MTIANHTTDLAPSYSPETIGRSFDEEITRLRIQMELSWPVEQRRLTALGVRDGQRLLEPGCGPGLVTERLATWLPHSEIVALDSDVRMLNTARKMLPDFQPLHRVSFQEASASDTRLPSHSFDVAISRYLFQHLRDPQAAAIEIRRVLRPGGVHIVIDVDDGLWGLVEPRFPEFEAWHLQRAKAQCGHGGDRFRGRRLGRILREAGYRNVELDVFAYHSDECGIEAFAAHLDPNQFLPLLDEGRMSVAEYAKAKVLYRKFLESRDAFLLTIGFIVYAETPQ
jgi:ubiquinone/menaquinone biosynthesis C-methylase UbiE